MQAVDSQASFSSHLTIDGDFISSFLKKFIPIQRNYMYNERIETPNKSLTVPHMLLLD
jgi:hypothetical protein